MSLQSRLTGASLTLGLVLTFGAVAFAQQPQQQPSVQGTTQSQQEGRPMGPRGRRRGGRDGDLGMMRVFRELNLTEAQQQQMRAIREKYSASMQPQREELQQLREQFEQGTATPDATTKAQSLVAQLRASGKAMRSEMLTVLTAEQRTQLEQIEKERKARREEMRQRRGMGQPNDEQ
jgi:Spy/CpxP family protein refolding chaperone